DVTRHLIDSHLHIWERARNPQNWIDPATMSAIDRDFGPDAAAQEMSARQVDGCVVIQCVNTFSETLDLLAAADSVGAILGVVGWVDLQADVPAQLDRLRAAPGGRHLVGVRHVTTIEADESWLSRADVARGLTSLASAGLPFDVVVQPSQLPVVKTLAQSIGQATFVLDHLGNPPIASSNLARWSADLAALATCENVLAKVSGLITKDDWDHWTVDRLRPVIDHALEAFGPRRLMFGSDWPLAELAGGYRPWKNAYLQLTDDLTPAEKASIDAESVSRVYGLR
ncbi:MAG TPA: amidohydrolase family protein, partial [Acidothermaceae bacterium]